MAANLEDDSPLYHEDVSRRTDRQLRAWHGTLDPEDWDQLEYEEEISTFQPLRKSKKNKKGKAER